MKPSELTFVRVRLPATLVGGGSPVLTEAASTRGQRRQDSKPVTNTRASGN